MTGKKRAGSTAKKAAHGKRTEEASREEFDAQLALLDNIPGCIAMVIRKGNREIVASNRFARDIGAVPGRTCFSTCAARDDPCPFCLAPELWATGQPQRIEVEYREKWYEGIWTPLTDELYVHYIFDITDRRHAENRQQLVVDILEILARPNQMTDVIDDLLHVVKSATGIEAVGLRLRDGDDYPYYVQNGFPDAFVQKENSLCVRDADGEPFLECMCGNILCGRTDPSKLFFTEGGSFWTNSTTQLLASTTDADCGAHTRNHCNTAGYESVALIPLRGGEETIGLLQLNDHRAGCFTLEMIRFFEGMGQSIGIAVARRRTEEDILNLARFPAENTDPVLRVAGDGTLLYANAASEFLLADWCCEVGRPAPESWRNVAAEALVSGFARQVEADYGQRIFAFMITPVAESGYVNLYGRDITEQRQAEEKMTDAVRRLTEACRVGRIGCFELVPSDGRITWTEEMYRIYGLQPQDTSLAMEEVLGMIHPDDRDGMRARMTETATSGRQRFEHRIVRPDGEVRWILGSAMHERDATSGERRVFGMLQDITEQRATEEQLRQSQKMEAIGLLAGGIAHDFRNMLTVIRGFGEMLLNRSLVSEEGRAYMEEILKAAKRSTALTGQLLAFSRREILRPEVVDLNEVVADIAKSLPQMLGEDICLSTVFGCSSCCAHLDMNQLQQAILNLAVNARHAMPDGGKLAIDTDCLEADASFVRRHADLKPGPYVAVSVTDMGCGMNAETLEKIFDPFFTTRGVGQGTGLGLAMVYGFVQQSGGAVEVDSEPGKGSVFRLCFPRVQAAAARVGGAKIPRDTLQGSETILLVEDEEAVRQMFAMGLRESGYTVIEAGNADEALPIAEHYGKRIDVLITDFLMPGMNGAQLAERFVQSRPGIPVLYMTGYGDRDMSQCGLEGVDSRYLLVKPCSIDEMASRIREILDKPPPRPQTNRIITEQSDTGDGK